MTDEQDEEEQYILTKEEENRLIENEINRLRNHAAWKLGQMGMEGAKAYSKEEIDHKLSGINWEEKINRDELFKRANSIKHYDIWQKEQRLREREEMIIREQQLYEKWTAKRMYHLMAWTSENIYGEKLIVNDANKHLITTLCYFLSRDERFATDLGFDKKKGLILRGPSGVGKTHVVKCVEENELNPLLILSMIEITDEIKQSGGYEILMGNKRVLYLDDVGTEEPSVNHYGTKVLFFKNFIESYYLKNKTFERLIISTNLNFSEIGEMYGFRVERRMRDMFNVVNVVKYFNKI